MKPVPEKQTVLTSPLKEEDTATDIVNFNCRNIDKTEFLSWITNVMANERGENESLVSRLYDEFKDEILVDELVPTLFEKDMITEEERQEIKSEKTMRKKVKLLFQIICQENSRENIKTIAKELENPDIGYEGLGEKLLAAFSRSVVSTGKNVVDGMPKLTYCRFKAWKSSQGRHLERQTNSNNYDRSSSVSKFRHAPRAKRMSPKTEDVGTENMVENGSAQENIQRLYDRASERYKSKKYGSCQKYLSECEQMICGKEDNDSKNVEILGDVFHLHASIYISMLGKSNISRSQDCRSNAISLLSKAVERYGLCLKRNETGKHFRRIVHPGNETKGGSQSIHSKLRKCYIDMAKLCLQSDNILQSPVNDISEPDLNLASKYLKSADDCPESMDKDTQLDYRITMADFHFRRKNIKRALQYLEGSHCDAVCIRTRFSLFRDRLKLGNDINSNHEDSSDDASDEEVQTEKKHTIIDIKLQHDREPDKNNNEETDVICAERTGGHLRVNTDLCMNGPCPIFEERFTSVESLQNPFKKLKLSVT